MPTPALLNAPRGSLIVGARQEQLRSAAAEREAFLRKMRVTAEMPAPDANQDQEVYQTYAWVFLGESEFWGGRIAHLGLLQEALEVLAAGERGDLVHNLLLWGFFNGPEEDQEFVLDLAWAVRPASQALTIRQMAAVEPWLELVSGLRVRGRLSDAEVAVRGAIDAVEASLAKLRAQPESDEFMLAYLLESLALLHSYSLHVQLAFGLPDQARTELQNARNALQDLSASGTDYPDDERSALEATLTDDECNLWVLADRHGRRRNTATKELEALKAVGLIDDQLRVASERASALNLEPYLANAVPRLRWHAALGELLEEREAGRELSSERREAFERELESLAAAGGLQGDDRLRIFDRLAFEALRRGQLDEARSQLRRGRDSGALEGDPAKFTVSELSIAALESRLSREVGADRQERLERLHPLIEGTLGILARWDASELRSGGLGFLDFQARREVLLTALVETQELLGETAAFELYFEAKRRGSLERSLGLEAPTLSEVQSSLCDQGSGVMLLLRGQSELLVGLIDARTAGFTRIPFSDAEAAQVDRLREALLTPDASRRRAVPQSAEISRHLLRGELADRLRGWRHVYVVGREFVRELPIGVLELDGEPLGLRTPYSYLPSTALGVELARNWRIEGLGGPQLWMGELDGRSVGLSDARLGPAALGELHRSLSKAGRVFDHRPDQVARLSQAKLGDASFATIFAHGRLDLSRSRPAGLWIGPESTETLWCEDAASLQPAQVMVLSACGAARSNTRIGDGGIGSLGGAFLEAGSGAVVLAAADVPRDGTVALTSRLQSALVRGASVAEALMSAKRSMASSEDFSDPYQFSNFHVFGLGHLALPDLLPGDGAWSPVPISGETHESTRPGPVGLARWLVPLVLIVVLGLALRTSKKSTASPETPI